MSAKILRFAAQICIKMYAYFFFRFNSARCMVLQESKLQEILIFSPFSYFAQKIFAIY